MFKTITPALLLGALLLAIPAPAQASPATVTVMTSNLCGWVCNRSEVPKRANLTVTQTLASKADVLLLQEACYRQYRAIRAKLIPKGWQATYVTTTKTAHCKGGRYGIAVLVKGTIHGARQVTRLPNPEHAEPRALLCADTTVKGQRGTVCVAHLSYTGANHQAQMKAMTAVVNSHPGSVILGGDLNAAKATLPPLREVDPANRVTYKHPTLPASKIDYIFTRAKPVSAKVLPDRLSDHSYLVAVVGQ